MSTLDFDLEPSWPRDEPLAPEDFRQEIRSICHTFGEYIEPGSILSLDEATNQVLTVHGSAKRPEYLSDSISNAFKTIGQQIHYDNPAQTKLITLFLSIGKNWKYQAKYPIDTQENYIHSYIECLRPSYDEGTFWPGDWEGDGEHPMFYVNACALLARLTSQSLALDSKYGHWIIRELGDMMDEAVATHGGYEGEDTTTREERHPWIMGAALVMRLRAELIFSFVRKYDNPLPPKIKISKWSNLKRELYRIFCPHIPSLEREELQREQRRQAEAGPEFQWDKWHAWRRTFEEVERDHTYSEICRELAKDAIGLMILEEKKYADSKYTKQTEVVYKEKETLA